MDKIIIVDCRADTSTIQSLQKICNTIIPTQKLDCLYDAVASHADIQIHYLGNNRFVCAPQVFEHYRQHLPSEFTLIKGSVPLKEKYPYDIPYNAAALGKSLICNSRSTAIEILETYRCSSRNILNVAQGYAKCSTCVIGANAIITADAGIANIAEKHCIDVLKINPGHIKLRGMNYGFIGGTSGLIDKNTLAFNGELNTHPDGEKIRNFCSNHNVLITELKKGTLTDIGSIIANIDF